MNPEQSPPAEQDPFASSRSTTEELTKQLEQLGEQAIRARLEKGQFTEQDAAEVAALSAEAQQQLAEKSPGETALEPATEAAGLINDDRLKDQVYVALAEAYAAHGEDNRGLFMAGSIKGLVPHIEALSRLSAATESDATKMAVGHKIQQIAANEAGAEIDYPLAQQIRQRYVNERKFQEAENFAEIIAHASAKAPNAPLASADPETTIAFAKGQINMNPPASVGLSIETQAKTLTNSLRAGGLQKLAEYHNQALGQTDPVIRDEMLAKYALTSVQLANERLHPDQAAA